MHAIPRMELITSPSRGSSDSLEDWTGRIFSIGRWMVILGFIRLAAASVDLTASHAGPIPSQTVSSSLAVVGRMVAEHSPFAVLGLIWLVALGILVCRTRWPELLRAASVTYFLLAASGLATIALEWATGEEGPIAIGSFEVNRSALALSNPGGVILALIGTAQLVAELAVAVRSTLLLRRHPHHPPGWGEVNRASWFEEMAPRTRSLVCQGCWVLSLVSLFVVVRPPALPKASRLLSASPMLRELLLRTDPSSLERVKPRLMNREALGRERAFHRLVTDAAQAWEEDRYDDAAQAYEEVIAIYRSSAILQDHHSRNNLALLANNLAWLLVTRPDPHPGDAKKAVESAQLALATNPAEGRYWNTLGAAQYRAGNWQGAKDALMRSMELRGDGDGYDWVLFALLYSRTGPKSRALEWYKKAARWREDFAPWEKDLHAFESEAAERLGLPEPPAPTPRPSFHDTYHRRDATSKHQGFPGYYHEDVPRYHRRRSHRSSR
jgi:tetratricopeptide (TPR) repeat protein